LKAAAIKKHVPKMCQIRYVWKVSLIQAQRGQYEMDLSKIRCEIWTGIKSQVREHGNVSSESIKGREYLDQLCIFLLLKEYSILI
jgi:hypothetical protein